MLTGLGSSGQMPRNCLGTVFNTNLEACMELPPFLSCISLFFIPTRDRRSVRTLEGCFHTTTASIRVRQSRRQRNKLSAHLSSCRSDSCSNCDGMEATHVTMSKRHIINTLITLVTSVVPALPKCCCYRFLKLQCGFVTGRCRCLGWAS
jgi:hypothetical protein